MKFLKLEDILVHFDLNYNASKERMKSQGWPYWNEHEDVPVTPVIDFIFGVETNEGYYQFAWRAGFVDIIQYEDAKTFTEELRYPSGRGYEGGQKPIDFIMHTITEGFRKFMLPAAQEFHKTGKLITSKRLETFEEYVRNECKKAGIPKLPKFHLKFRNDLKEKCEK